MKAEPGNDGWVWTMPEGVSPTVLRVSMDSGQTWGAVDPSSPWASVRAEIRALRDDIDRLPEHLRRFVYGDAEARAVHDDGMERTRLRLFAYSRCRRLMTTSTRKRQGGRRKHNGQLAKLRRIPWTA